jgi:hypothetical protein
MRRYATGCDQCQSSSFVTATWRGQGKCARRSAIGGGGGRRGRPRPDPTPTQLRNSSLDAQMQIESCGGDANATETQA